MRERIKLLTTTIVAAIWTKGVIVAEFQSINEAVDSNLKAIPQLDSRICFYSKEEWERED